MTYDPDFVEFVVQEVLRRLRADGGKPAAATAGSAGERQRELALPDRLITLATLSGRLDRLVVASRCVVTPAARDELRARGIELRRGGK